MKLKVILITLIIALLSVLVACNVVEVGDVSNLVYSDGIITFDEVENASGYEVSILHGDQVVYEDTIHDTAIDVTALGLGGNLTIKVNAYIEDTKGSVSSIDFVQLSTFEDVIFEAEEWLANFGTGKSQSNFRNNTLAHKGAYVGGIDDAGQGIYINYLCPVAGTYTFEAYYCTDQPTSLNDVWVNGSYQTQFVFTEKTGWGGDTFDAEMTSTTITLVEGWNTISVYKNGDSSNNWGSYTELDYFVLKGTGQQYNMDDLDVYGVRPAAYRLEGEMGSPRHKNTASNLYECKNPAIVETDTHKYSNGFILGNIDSNYDGVEWHFNSPVKAKYRVTIGYAAGYVEGALAPAPTFFVTQSEVGIQKNIDFNKMEGVTMASLPYTGWNVVQESEVTVDIVLEAGKNFIYCLKLDSVSGIFQIDYIDLVFVEEIVD